MIATCATTSPCRSQNPRVVELRRRDSDHGERGSLKAYATADSVAQGAEQTSGQTAGQHHDVRRADMIIGGREQSAGASTHAEQVEPLARDCRPLHRHRRPVIEVQDRGQCACIRVGGDTADCAQAFAHALVRLVRERPVAESPFGFGRPDDEQTSLLLDRERLEEHAVDNAEHGGRGTDSQRQRTDGDQRKGGRLAEQTNTMTKIGEESVHSVS